MSRQSGATNNIVVPFWSPPPPFGQALLSQIREDPSELQMISSH